MISYRQADYEDFMQGEDNKKRHELIDSIEHFNTELVVTIHGSDGLALAPPQPWYFELLPSINIKLLASDEVLRKISDKIKSNLLSNGWVDSGELTIVSQQEPQGTDLMSDMGLPEVGMTTMRSTKGVKVTYPVNRKLLEYLL